MLGELSVKHGEAIGRSQAEAARSTMASLQELMPRLAIPRADALLSEYLRDAGQRWVLFFDTLCQRGDAATVREKEGFKPVLTRPQRFASAFLVRERCIAEIRVVLLVWHSLGAS
jgi:hypothetical protein